jgi:predicted PurR-regulated permease PerM
MNSDQESAKTIAAETARRAGLNGRGEGEPDHAFGTPGRPISRRNFYLIGLLLGLGAITAYGLLWVVTSAEQEILLIALALLIALGLDPIVVMLTRRGLSRGWAVTVVALLGLAAAAGFLILVVPVLSTQATQFADNLPAYLKRLQDHNSAIGKLNERYHVLDNLQDKVGKGGLGALPGALFGAGKVIVSAVAGTILVTVLSLYLLATLPSVKEFAWRFAPLARRERVQLLTEAVCGRVGGYVLGNVLTSLIAGIGTLVWALILGIPDPLLLGVLVAVLDLVPIIGSTVGGGIVALVALTVSLPVAGATVVFYVAYRLLEDYLIVPRIMGRTVEVVGLVTVVAVMIGGALLGVIGALLAIPIAAAIKLLLEEIAFRRLDQPNQPSAG